MPIIKPISGGASWKYTADINQPILFDRTDASSAPFNEPFIYNAPAGSFGILVTLHSSVNTLFPNLPSTIQCFFSVYNPSDPGGFNIPDSLLQFGTNTDSFGSARLCFVPVIAGINNLMVDWFSNNTPALGQREARVTLEGILTIE